MSATPAVAATNAAAAATAATATDITCSPSLGPARKQANFVVSSGAVGKENNNSANAESPSRSPVISSGDSPTQSSHLSNKIVDEQHYYSSETHSTTTSSTVAAVAVDQKIVANSSTMALENVENKSIGINDMSLRSSVNNSSSKKSSSLQQLPTSTTTSTLYASAADAGGEKDSKNDATKNVSSAIPADMHVGVSSNNPNLRPRSTRTASRAATLRITSESQGRENFDLDDDVAIDDDSDSNDEEEKKRPAKKQKKKSGERKVTKSEKVKRSMNEGNRRCGCGSLNDDEMKDGQYRALQAARALLASHNKQEKSTSEEKPCPKFILTCKPSMRNKQELPSGCLKYTAAEKADLASLAQHGTPMRSEYSDSSDPDVQRNARECYVKKDGGYYPPNTKQEEVHFRPRPGDVNRVDCAKEGCDNNGGKGFTITEKNSLRTHMGICQGDATQCGKCGAPFKEVAKKRAHENRCESQDEFEALVERIKRLLKKLGSRPGQHIAGGKLVPYVGFPKSADKQLYHIVRTKTGLSSKSGAVPVVGERKEALQNLGYTKDLGFFP
jgi:hypothetical protein